MKVKDSKMHQNQLVTLAFNMSLYAHLMEYNNNIESGGYLLQIRFSRNEIFVEVNLSATVKTPI
jgi:cell division protein YceG involved in septum cleavage